MSEKEFTIYRKNIIATQKEEREEVGVLRSGNEHVDTYIRITNYYDDGSQESGDWLFTGRRIYESDKLGLWGKFLSKLGL